MHTYIQQLDPLHYKSVKDIFTVFYKSGIKNEDLSYYWRHRSREESVGIFHEGDLLGFALLMNRASTPGNMYLSYIAVHPDFKGLDLGSKLLMFILAKCLDAKKSIHLVPLSSPKLRQWYVMHGFKFTQKNCMNFHSYPTRQNRLCL
jgi:GNAT superfamily N-acetyltransferase